MKKVVFVFLLLCAFFCATSAFADTDLSGNLPSFNPPPVTTGGSNSQMNGSGTASNPDGPGVNQFNDRTDSSSALFFTPSPGDVSIDYLGNIFGNIGTTINGAGVPLLGQLFSVFNSALIGLALMILGYLVFRGVLDTAAQGEFLGKELNSVWVPLRVVLGIILLIPRKAGYCLAQLIIVQIIVMGVGVADTTWDAAVNYFQNGGGLLPFNHNSSSDGSGSLAYKEQQIKLTDNFSRVFESLVCMQAFTKNIPNTPLASPTYSKPDANGIASFSFKVSDIGGNPATSFDCGHVSWNTTDTAGTPTTYGTGSILAMKDVVSVLNTDANLLVNSGDNDSELYGIIGNNFIHNMAELYQGTIADAVTSGPTNQTNSFMNSARSLGWAGAGLYIHQMLTLNNLVTQVQIPTALGPDPSPTSPLAPGQPYASIGTVIGAGNTFVDYLEASAAQQSASENILFFPFNPGGHADTVKDKSQLAWINRQVNAAGNYFGSGAMLNPKNWGKMFHGLGNDIHKSNRKIYCAFHKNTCRREAAAAAAANPPPVFYLLVGCDSGLPVPVHTVRVSAEPTGAALTALQQEITQTYPNQCVSISWDPHAPANSIADKIYNGVNAAMTYAISNGNVQPLLAVQNVGQGLVDMMSQLMNSIVSINETKTTLAENKSTMAGVLGLIPVVGPSLSSWESADMTAELSMLTSEQGFLIALCVALMVPASILAVYIPMLPYFLFIIGLLGWVLTVFESVVAAPIVALGIIHPEGHAVYGKSEPAVMILVNVFIKPMLMIIGLMASILIADATVWFVNTGFFIVVNTTFGSVLTPDSNITDAAIFAVMILFVYMALILALLNKCFQLIYVIPDKIMRWLTGGVAMDQGEGQVLGEVKSQYGQDIGEAKGATSKGLETSVAMNDAQNKKVQEETAAEFSLGQSSGKGGSDTPAPPTEAIEMM